MSEASETPASCAYVRPTVCMTTWQFSSRKPRSLRAASVIRATAGRGSSDSVHHRQELARVAGARVVLGELAAVVDVERAQLGRRLGLLAAQHERDRDGDHE